MAENIPPTSRNLFGGSLSPLSGIGGDGGGVSKAPPHRLDTTVAPIAVQPPLARPTTTSGSQAGGPTVAAVQNARPKPVVVGKSTISQTTTAATAATTARPSNTGVAVVPRPKGLAGGNPTTIASELVAAQLRPTTARQRTSRPSSASAVPKPQQQPATSTASTAGAVPAPDSDGKYFTGLFAEEHKRLYLQQRDKERRDAEWGNKVKAEEKRLYDAARQYTGVVPPSSRPSSAAPRGGAHVAPRATKSPPQPFKRTQSGGLSKRPPPPAPWHEPCSSPVHHTTDNDEWEQHVRQVHDEQRQRQAALNNKNGDDAAQNRNALDSTALPPQTFIVSPRKVEEEVAAAEAAAALGTVTSAGRVRILPSKVVEHQQQEVVGESPCPVPPPVDDDDTNIKPTATKAMKPTVTKTKKKVSSATANPAVSSPSAAAHRAGGKGGAGGASPQPPASSTGLVVVNYYARCDHCSKLVGVQYEHPSAADMGHHSTSAMAATAALNKLVKQRKDEASTMALNDHYDSGDCPLVPLKCELINSETGDECGHIVRGGALMLEHQTSKCPNRVVPCPNYVAADEGTTSSPHDEDAVSMSCQKLISAGSIGLHLQRCAAEMVQCRHCRAFFLESEEMKRLEVAAEREEKRELRHGVVLRGVTDKVECAAILGQSITASQSSRPTSPRLTTNQTEAVYEDEDDANVGGEVLASSIASLRLTRDPTSFSRNASMRLNRIATGNLGGGEEEERVLSSAKGRLEAIHRHIEDNKVERYGWVRRGDLSRHYSLCPNKLVPCPVPGCLLCTRQHRQRVANAAAAANDAFSMDASLTFNGSVVSSSMPPQEPSSSPQISYYSPLLNRKASSRKLLLGRGEDGDQSAPPSVPNPLSATPTSSTVHQLLRRAEVPNHVEHVIHIICKASTRYAQERLALDDPPGPIGRSATSPGRATNTAAAAPPTAAALVVRYVKAFCNDNHIAKIRSLPTTLIPPPSSSATTGLLSKSGNVPPEYVLRCLERLGANPTCYYFPEDRKLASGDVDDDNRVLTSRDVEGNPTHLLPAGGGGCGGRRARSMTPAAALVAVSADDPIITLSVVLQSLVHDRISSTVHAHFAQRSSIKREVHVLEVQHAMITAYQTKRRNEEVDALQARIAELEAKLAAAKGTNVPNKTVDETVSEAVEEVTPTEVVAEDREAAVSPVVEDTPINGPPPPSKEDVHDNITTLIPPANDTPLPDSQPDVLAPEPVRHDTTYTTPMAERRRRRQVGIMPSAIDVSGGDDSATNEALAASLRGYSIDWEGGGGDDGAVAAEDDDGEIYGSPFILDDSSTTSLANDSNDLNDDDITPANDDLFDHEVKSLSSEPAATTTESTATKDDIPSVSNHQIEEAAHGDDDAPKSPSTNWIETKESPSPEHPSLDPPAPDCATRCGSLMPPPHTNAITSSSEAVESTEPLGGDNGELLEKEGVDEGTPTPAAAPTPKCDPAPTESSRLDDSTAPAPVLPTTTASGDDIIQPTSSPKDTATHGDLPATAESITEEAQILPVQPTATSSVACIAIDRRLMSLLPTDASRSKYEEVIRQVQVVFNWFHETSEWAKATKTQEEVSTEDQAKAESLQIDVKCQVENITAQINNWRNSVGENADDAATFSDPQLRARITYVLDDLEQELTQLRLQQHRIKSSLFSIAWAA